MHNILEKISEIGIVPVAAIEDASKAVPLAKALSKGGIPCIEVTFRTKEGEESIKRISAEMPDILLGAGTVTTTEQVDKAINAGAKFIVSPGFNPKIVSYCAEKQIPITPGCSCPSDIEKALEFGLEVVKFFPAEQSGGLDFIKAVSAPYTTVKFMPTGGINISNITKYLAFDKIIACGGSWMVKPELVKQDKFDEITEECKKAVQQILGFELGHVGINAENASESEKAVKIFETMFGFGFKEGNSSNFAGKYVEIMKTPYLGSHGHIAIATNSVKRAKAHLQKSGFSFIEDTAKYNDKGKLMAIYLQEEVLGFSLHLVLH